ncbi:hypothetical protein [Rhizobium binxianense]
MNDGRSDGFTMIGLHKLAAHNGEGLVPELYELLASKAELPLHQANATAFPIREARLPGHGAKEPLGQDAANGDNIVVFARPAQGAGKRKA